MYVCARVCACECARECVDKEVLAAELESQLLGLHWPFSSFSPTPICWWWAFIFAFLFIHFQIFYNLRVGGSGEGRAG